MQGGFPTQVKQTDCNMESCPYTWSSWSESIPCNVSCGGGTRQLISMCYDEDKEGNTVALCDSKYVSSHHIKLCYHCGKVRANLREKFCASLTKLNENEMLKNVKRQYS